MQRRRNVSAFLFIRHRSRQSAAMPCMIQNLGNITGTEP